MIKRPILIADPDIRVASLAAHGLRKEGYRVATAQCGESVLTLLPTRPLLIFSEVELPGIDGHSLCRHLKKDALTREIPFFLLSHRRDQNPPGKAFANGAHDYLAKPLYVRDLCTLAGLFAGHAPGNPVITGQLGTITLFHILRALTSGLRSGEVHVPEEDGEVFFHHGNLVHASAGKLCGEAAIARLLVLSSGRFVIRFGPVSKHDSICYSLRDLVTYDEPRKRKFEQAVAQMGSADSRLVVNTEVLLRKLPEIPASIEKIVRLFDGKRTLGEVLRVSDADEIFSVEAVLRLYQEEILVLSSQLFQLCGAASC